MSHSTHMNGSWHTYLWVMTHTWMSIGTHVIESWHTYVWVIVHIWKSHGKYMNESCHACRHLCVAVCCSMSQCIAVCCSVLQCVALCCSMWQWAYTEHVPSLEQVCVCLCAGMGWLRLVVSSKLQVSFAEYWLLYTALLQKRPIILRSLLVIATP